MIVAYLIGCFISLILSIVYVNSFRNEWRVMGGADSFGANELKVIFVASIISWSSVVILTYFISNLDRKNISLFYKHGIKRNK
jgi:hypothetical protein